MTEIHSSTPQPGPSRFQFGLSSLFLLTLLVACILSIYRCLGPMYGVLSAIPLSIVATLLLYTRWRCTFGSLIGAGTLAVLGFFILVHWNPSDPKYVKSIVTLGAFGGAVGASIHAIILKRWIVGSILLAISILILLGTLLG
jgi:hypothetical protein